MTRVVVYHGGYGCDTGCCGHYVDFEGLPRKFDFSHASPGQDPLEYARDLVAEKFGKKHVADLDWDHCIVLDGDTCL